MVIVVAGFVERAAESRTDITLLREAEIHGSMQSMAPVINKTLRGGTRQLAFMSAVLSVVASFAAAAAPIPLYNIYRAEDGFSNGCTHADAIHTVTPSADREPACTAALSFPAFLTPPAGQLGTHAGGRVGHVAAQLGPLI